MEAREKAGSEDERRQHERIAKNLAVRYTRLEDLLDEASPENGELLDLGGGGLCFLAEAPIPLSTQLVIVLEFPGWHAENGKWVATKVEDDVGVLQAVGQVSWVAASRSRSGRYEIGVQFSGMLAP
ncbi:PilZ domain-containing protein [Thiovibrio sp. JS02]